MAKREKDEREERESVLDFLHSLKKGKDFRGDREVPEKSKERKYVFNSKEEPKGEQDALEFLHSLENVRDFREFMKDPATEIQEEPPRGTQDSIYGPGNPAVHP